MSINYGSWGSRYKKNHIEKQYNSASAKWRRHSGTKIKCIFIKEVYDESPVYSNIDHCL